MARSRDGGGRRARRRRSLYAVADLDDDNSDDSDRDSVSSGNNNLELKTSDTVLDNALFGFVKKQGVKSLKRKFSEFCKDVSISAMAKMNKTDGVSRNVFSRYSLKYFVEVIKKLTPEQRFVISKFGFGCLLLLDLHDIPSEFARWVADCVDPICSQMTVDCKLVDISQRTVHVILGLPIGGLEVPCNSNDGMDFILSHFKLSEIPHITFFGNKLCGSEDLSEHDVFVCFMAIAISCFLCPNPREYPNCKYLSVLKFPEEARRYDFSKLVYDCFLESIGQYGMSCKLKGRRPKTPICCNYVTVVHYLDCLDFGRQNVDQGIPRITVWKGTMIRVFSELDRKGRQCYGKKHLKEALASCRVQGVLRNHEMHQKRQSPVFDPVPLNFRENVHSKFLNNLRADVIDGILNTVDTFVSSNCSTKPKIEKLVNDVLDFLSKTRSSGAGQRSSGFSPLPVMSKSLGGEQIEATKTVHDIEMNVLASKLCETAAPPKHQVHEVSELDIKDKNDPVTPECFITKVVEANTVVAPAINPLKKAKSRRYHLKCVEDEGTKLSQGLHSPSFKDNLGTSHVAFGPVARIILPDSPCAEPCTTEYNLKRLHPVDLAKPPVFSAKPPVVSPKHCVNGNNPNIQLVGSSDFRRSSTELAKKVDNTYNKLFSTEHRRTVVPPDFLENFHTESELHNFEGRHKPAVNRKYTLVNSLMTCQNPPLQKNIKFPVSDEDIINYSSIVELAHSIQHKKTLGVKYPEVHCNYQSLGESLMPDGEVDNFLIPCFCRMLFKDKHPSSSGRHYFFPHVGDAILNFDVVPNEVLVRTSFLGAAKASKGRILGCKDNRLFFPIVDSHHWFLFAVDFEFKLFAFLDSYHDKDSSFHKRIKNSLVDNFIHLWELIISEDHDFGNFKIMYPNVPKQLTVVDCGVFVMKFMEIWKPFLDLRRFFSHEDILNIRIQYAIKLFFHADNEADLRLVLDFHSKC